MGVEINNIKRIDDDKNWIYITLTVDGDVIRTTSVNPWNQPGPPLTGEALQTWCDNREDWFALNILKQMFPGARPTEDTREAFETWITSGHTNTAYCSIAEHDTEETCLADGGTWTPETVIEKVPFTDSHDYTGDMRTRKLEELNTDVNTYINSYYDTGTQQSFTAVYVKYGTQDVKDYLNPVWDWINAIMAYYYSKKSEITEANDINSITWDFSTTFDVSKPDVSLSYLIASLT